MNKIFVVIVSWLQSFLPILEARARDFEVMDTSTAVLVFHLFIFIESKSPKIFFKFCNLTYRHTTNTLHTFITTVTLIEDLIDVKMKNNNAVQEDDNLA
jgi:hypothetical protein